MRSSKRSIRQFFVQSDRGHIVQPELQFTSGLVSEHGSGYSPVSDDDVIAAALRILSQRLVYTSALCNPRTTRSYLALRFAGLEHEVFACIFLDARNRVMACEELFRGTIDGASVHPREVVKRALVHNAAAVIFTHNHPSGVAEPSHADELITRRLKDALALVDIRVLDHLVIGGAVVESFSERGLL
jgi:DNA repair protein RadC